MNSRKDQIEVSERRRRTIFVVKILVYVALLATSEYLGPLVAPYFPKVYRFLNALEVVVAGNLIISLGRIILIRFYLRKKRRTGLHGNFVLGINRIVSILNVIIVLLSIMVLFDIQPLEFLSSITIVAAAIALLSKDYITNMINGLIIMFSDQLTLGDHIKMGEFKGKIQDITLLNVIIANEDDDLVMIPNSLILSSNVINHSRQNVKKISLEFEMKLSERLNLDVLENALLGHFKPQDKHFSKNSFILKAMSIQKDAVKIKVQLQLVGGDRAVEKKIKRMLNQKIIQLSSEL
ncbi:MAG: mechanosensitive ion channel [Lunatimonas sp.]|uniref:mechanosensitive ion channel family protein n=1 Tax=Lunatimonas sp. TaxID=2060141 RepID=UPI00263B9C7D|nr:mechanosensitive ion channel domain-containing protein [Lunatimonas sp.]MCC5936763.1 mechanosensitive ion channel [Lunatimonas sp.]